MSGILFATITCGAALLVSLLFASIAFPELRVWPLPDDSGPASRVRRIANRVSGTMAVVLSAAVLVLAVLERGTLPLPTGLRIAGAVLSVLGAVLGVLGYVRLGPDLSHDRPGPLVSSGPYRISRNPQYVGAAALLLGFGLALASAAGLVAALACSAWYVAAPFAEESWLRERFGDRYRAYLRSAPRYLGRPTQARPGG